MKYGLCRRVIPVVGISDFKVIKTTNFSRNRNFGNIGQTIRAFTNRRVDELIILDYESSKPGGAVNSDLLNLISENCHAPLVYGGGISNVEQIARCLEAGADRVTINTAARNDPLFLTRAAVEFGAQCIICSIDVIKCGEDFYVFDHTTHSSTGIKLCNYIERVAESNPSELLITSVDRNGTLEGYDMDLLQASLLKTKIPILINGGCSNPLDIKEALLHGATGACASSVYLYTEYGYQDLKSAAMACGDFNVRP